MSNRRRIAQSDRQQAVTPGDRWQLPAPVSGYLAAIAQDLNRLGEVWTAALLGEAAALLPLGEAIGQAMAQLPLGDEARHRPGDPEW